MDQMTFETLILPAEYYRRWLEWSAKYILGFCVILILIEIVSRCMKIKFHVPVMWFVNMPKMVFFCAGCMVGIFS